MSQIQIIIKNNTAAPVFLAGDALSFEVPVGQLDVTGFIGLDVIRASSVLKTLLTDALPTLTLNLDGTDVPKANVTGPLRTAAVQKSHEAQPRRSDQRRVRRSAGTV